MSEKEKDIIIKKILYHSISSPALFISNNNNSILPIIIPLCTNCLKNHWPKCQSCGFEFKFEPLLKSSCFTNKFCSTCLIEHNNLYTMK